MSGEPVPDGEYARTVTQLWDFVEELQASDDEMHANTLAVILTGLPKVSTLQRVQAATNEAYTRGRRDLSEELLRMGGWVEVCEPGATP